MTGKKRTAGQVDVDARFLLANERTLLAWIRTGLAMIAGGVAVGFLSSTDGFATAAGVGAICFGGLICLLGYRRYLLADQAIRQGRLPAAGASSMLVVVGVTVFAVALLLLREVYH